MNDPTHTRAVTLDGSQMETLRLALADAAELRTESGDSYCADCELSAQWCDQHQAGTGTAAGVQTASRHHRDADRSRP